MPNRKTPTTTQLDEFVRGYLVSALWTSNDETTDTGGEPMDANYDITDIAPQCVAGARATCLEFMTANYPDLLKYAASRKINVGEGTIWEHAGHDFWLTRNGHGVGFWDRDLGELGDRLSDASKAHKEIDLYLGEDGKLYFTGLENYGQTPPAAPEGTGV